MNSPSPARSALYPLLGPRKSMMDASQLAEHFLLAMPSLSEDYFANALTYLLEHDVEGAMGVIINRPCEMSFNQVLEQLDIPVNSLKTDTVEVLYGGPLHQDRGLVLHDGAQDWESTLRLSTSLAITSSRDILIDLANGCGPEQATLFLGYTGWEQGQLEEELRDNAWLACEGSSELIFHTPLDQRVRQATAKLGIEYQQLSAEHGLA